ncbi:MAG: penicillin-binding transpeptidase domain-containing protein [Trichloromonadaceae bacterium]
MPRASRYPTPRQPSGGWRYYQSSLRRWEPRRTSPGQRPWLLRRLLLALLVVATLAGLAALMQNDPAQAPATAAKSAATAVAIALPTRPAPAPISPAAIPEDFDRPHLREFLDSRAFSNVSTRDLPLTVDGRQFTVETTLDPGLQSFLLSTLDRTNSRYVGITVIDPGSGKVLALAGYDRTDPDGNPCLDSQFPAASIFKIVTAAAAVEQLGYTENSPMSFGGGKYTLYKQQLTGKSQRTDTTLPLSEAFADSINPVFGKLGSLRLGKTRLEQAAATFGFNRPIDFELPLAPSHFQISDEPYNWAEIASGFNRQTTLSPLHGALLAAAIINGGQMPTPSIIETIADAGGEQLYRRPAPAQTPALFSPRTAAALVEMMEATINSGTARKAFSQYQKDRVLAGLQIGGKTGSLSNAGKDVRYDWFVGFAKERQGGRQLAVAVMVAHQDLIGIRAGDYARRTFAYYFGDPASAR